MGNCLPYCCPTSSYCEVVTDEFVWVQGMVVQTMELDSVRNSIVEQPVCPTVASSTPPLKPPRITGCGSHGNGSPVQDPLEQLTREVGMASEPSVQSLDLLLPIPGELVDLVPEPLDEIDLQDQDLLTQLPAEVSIKILHYLRPVDLLRLSCVSKHWFTLATDELIWKLKCGEQGLTRTDKSWKRSFLRHREVRLNWTARPLRRHETVCHGSSTITCLALSGNRVVSGSVDGTLSVVDITTGKVLRTLQGHTGGVWAAVMEGSLLVSASRDRTLKVWNVESEECLHTLVGHTRVVRCLALHGNTVVSGSRDSTVRMWNVTTGECLAVFLGHRASVQKVLFDGDVLISGGYDHDVIVWDQESRMPHFILRGHTGRVTALKFQGGRIFSGSEDGSIRIWDSASGECTKVLSGNGDAIKELDLQGNLIVSGNQRGTLALWDWATGIFVTAMQGPHGHTEGISGVVIVRNTVVTASHDGTVRLWDLQTGSFLRMLVSSGRWDIVWNIQASDSKLICSTGLRTGNGESSLMLFNFDAM